jgi:hypothetical protein
MAIHLLIQKAQDVEHLIVKPWSNTRGHQMTKIEAYDIVMAELNSRVKPYIETKRWTKCKPSEFREHIYCYIAHTQISLENIFYLRGGMT